MQKSILLLIVLVFSVGSVATAQSEMQQLPVPTVAPDYRAPQKPLPELTRVGVDMNRQRPLSLRESLSMALENNKDIEVARENVRIAEFDLLGAQGLHDPRLTTQAFYERIESPISSFLAGGQNGSTTTSDYTGTMRLEGQTPVLGGSYHLDFSFGAVDDKQPVHRAKSAVSDVAGVQLYAAAVSWAQD
jgi:HAE1 family hydrophobic/amphiphilic exporter-1